MEITRGKQNKPYRVVIYGTEGIGKSTFASKFPDPVFIDTEGSTNRMDIARMPKPTSWSYLLEEIRYVALNKPCKTLVIDTADWAEKLCIDSILSENGWKGIETPGYGNGYRYVFEAFGKMLNALNDVIEAGIHVVITSHARIVKFEQPDEMGAYDRYQLALIDTPKTSIARTVKEWADMILFANYKTFVVSGETKGSKKHAQGGKRVMYATHNPCWDAKNRDGLPDEMLFDFKEVAHLFEIKNEEKEKQTIPNEKTYGNWTPGGGNVDDSIDLTDYVGEESHIMEGKDIPKAIDYSTDEYKGLIPEVIQLMKENLIAGKELKKAVAHRGIVPESTPFTAYPEDWQRGDLVANWDGWKQTINDVNLPF